MGVVTMRTPLRLVLLALLVGGTMLPGEVKGQEPDIEGAYHRSFEHERAEAYQDAIRALAPVYEAYPN